MSSSIEWTDETWNPAVGCERVSPGCDNCYAVRVAHRQMPYHMNADPYEDDPLRFGVSFPGGFVEVVVALSGEPAPTEPDPEWIAAKALHLADEYASRKHDERMTPSTPREQTDDR